MPPKKTYPKREPPARDDPCMLLYGPRNNIIAWREAMEEKCVEKYGMSGTFFSTNKIYLIPYLREEDWHPYPEMLEPESDWDSDNGTDVTALTDVAVQPQVGPVADEGEEGAAVAPPAAIPAHAPEADVPPNGPTAEQRALITKMHGNAVDSRRRKIEEQELNLTKMWPLVYSCMSPQSQAKVKEFPGYEIAKSTRDVIKLWEYIRKSHLTHMYGATDKMRAVNVNDQKMKFNNMRQGDREFVSDFKTRYDNQLKANEGVGIVAEDESLVAIDFLSKLDPKRFTSMLTVLRNNAAINVSSYPTTLAGAYRTASTWTSDGLTPFSREHHSAFVVDKGQGFGGTRQENIVIRKYRMFCLRKLRPLRPRVPGQKVERLRSNSPRRRRR
jgi:hypothetical protein